MTFTKAECFVRLTCPTTGKAVEISLSPDENYEDIFVCTHQNADGSYPTPAQCGNSGRLWSVCRELRLAEEYLRS